jgi:hypothetical protein
MNFQQDGGLSCVRYHLRAPLKDSLEALTAHALEARSKVVGRLNCHYCGEVDSWSVGYCTSRNYLKAGCGCNGSVLPVYIGAPPEQDLDDWTTCRCPDCHEAILSLALGIGYTYDAVPNLGTLDVERAVALAAGLRCRACQREFVGWRLSRSQPPDILGEEPWLRRIQGLHPG